MSFMRKRLSKKLYDIWEKVYYPEIEQEFFEAKPEKVTFKEDKRFVVWQTSWEGKSLLGVSYALGVPRIGEKTGKGRDAYVRQRSSQFRKKWQEYEEKYGEIDITKELAKLYKEVTDKPNRYYPYYMYGFPWPSNYQYQYVVHTSIRKLLSSKDKVGIIHASEFYPKYLKHPTTWTDFGKKIAKKNPELKEYLDAIIQEKKLEKEDYLQALFLDGALFLEKKDVAIYYYSDDLSAKSWAYAFGLGYGEKRGQLGYFTDYEEMQKFLKMKS